MTGTDTPPEPGTGRAGTLPERFEEHARAAPEAVALRWAGTELRYGELDARADRLARHLVGRGLRPGRLAAVAFGRGVEVYVALLAVLKTGAAYLPLEPGAPDPLLRHVLAEAAPDLVVTEEAHRIRLTDAGARELVCVDAAGAAGEAHSAGPHPVDPHPAELDPDGLAVVLTTSGTTGPPRCAGLSHRNLLAAHHGWRTVYGITPVDRILSTASLEFDVFTADWVRALCSGATLVVAPRNLTLDRAADIADLPPLIAAERITLLELNTRTARRLTALLAPTAGGRPLAGVRVLTVGAEKWWLDEHLALQRLVGRPTRVINVYGLAEASVDSTWFEVRGLDEVPGGAALSVVGLPFPGARVYVLDPDGTPLPDGAVGEIALAGPGLGPGYPGRPEETARRFVRSGHDPDGRVLLTGDLGRIAEGGTLEFVGRAAGVVGPTDAGPTDARVSAAAAGTVSRAARAEARLRARPGIREAAVAEMEVAPGRRELVGYAVTVPGAPDTDGWSLTAALTAALPAGEAPAAVVPVPGLPRTRAGKLDRDALPLPAPGDRTPPRRSGGGKGYRGKGGGGSGGGAESESFLGCGTVTVGVPSAAVAALLTDRLWPGSTDVSAVPAPYDTLFRVLYLFEWAAFGLGVAWLLFGAAVTARQRRPAGLSVAAHLAVFWLLASWWPQDNLYRTAHRADWYAQTWLVFVFNIALMVSAAIVVRFLTWQPRVRKRL
ncbi:AMP-binding protein [Kitasatospora purpeofusca]|uniref:AMP-binding protein n=1 Tax=Kitasatospora purpeofusca TaxID=67352 RepID=UPI0022595780|nr:AMP-binding protein [Kitasatospora purpeofusca]MCX4759251.1 AMP-binding protein [Kitasatospora purpeofusca]WSR30350.1 AMP-binding protein [Kitasatospora purpeofusca]